MAKIIDWDAAAQCAMEDSLLMTKSGADKFRELQDDLKKRYAEAADKITQREALERKFPGVTDR